MTVPSIEPRRTFPPVNRRRLSSYTTSIIVSASLPSAPSKPPICLCLVPSSDADTSQTSRHPQRPCINTFAPLSHVEHSFTRCAQGAGASFSSCVSRVCDLPATSFPFRAMERQQRGGRLRQEPEQTTQMRLPVSIHGVCQVSVVGRRGQSY